MAGIWAGTRRMTHAVARTFWHATRYGRPLDGGPSQPAPFDGGHKVHLFDRYDANAVVIVQAAWVLNIPNFMDTVAASRLDVVKAEAADGARAACLIVSRPIERERSSRLRSVFGNQSQRHDAASLACFLILAGMGSKHARFLAYAHGCLLREAAFAQNCVALRAQRVTRRECLDNLLGRYAQLFGSHRAA